MSQRSYRLFQAMILIGLGLFFLQRLWSGKLYYYINERFFILVILAAIGFLILAQVILPLPWRKAAYKQAVHSHEDDENDHTGHEHGEPAASRWSLIILALPLLLGLLVPARSLGASAIASKGFRTTAAFGARESSATIQLNLPADERTVLDWIRSFNYSNDPSEFSGEAADVIGFVYHDQRLPENQFLVGRFTLTCCVADAFAIGMIAEWPDAAVLKENTWVRVKGRVQVTNYEGQAFPLIQAESVKAVPEPFEPYLFP